MTIEQQAAATKLNMAVPIIVAVPIGGDGATYTVFDLHMACGHVLVSRSWGKERDDPMKGWQAMCYLCNDSRTRYQTDLFHCQTVKTPRL